MLNVDLDLLEIRDNEFVLDAGCGPGRHIWQVSKVNRGVSVAFDLDIPSLQQAKYMLEQMEQRSETLGSWHLVSGSVTSLPFADELFHKVICSEVLEHIPRDYEAVSEFIRVLKPGGILAVSVPSHFAESVCWKISDDYHNTPGGHIRIYKHQEILDLLRKHDLDIYAVRYKHALHSIYWWSKGIFGLKNEKAFIPSTYYKFLVWDIYSGHKYTHWIENGLNHLFPKSTVIYCRKP
ncbi:MAG: class I SAM-dependent methyltransferase [Chloroflexi bacterium]|nr:class I SAM-dependent methyltransferase [Chloroflexota bacterium]